MDKDTSDAIKLAWAFGIAAFAGLVSYAQRFTDDPRPKFSWLVAATKFLTAGFVGVLTGWLLGGWNVPPNFLHFAMAVAGYGGAETIVFFQQVFRDTVSRYAQKDETH